MEQKTGERKNLWSKRRAGEKIHGVKAGREKIYGRKNQFPSGVTLLLLLIVSLWGDGTKKVAGRR